MPNSNHADPARSPRSRTSTSLRPFLHGFFGAPNFGDEILCRAQLEHFGLDCGAVVATANAGVTRRTAAGLRKVSTAPGMLNHVGFYLGLPLRLARLRRSRALIIGGGGLFNDTFSQVTVMRSAFDAAWALRFGLPIYVLGLEIGSLYTPSAKFRAAFILRHARMVGCRDPQSLDRAAQLALPAISRSLVEMPDLGHALLQAWFARQPPPARAGHCVFNPRSVAASRPEEFALLIKGLCDRHTTVTLAAAQPGEETSWLKKLPERPTNLRVFSSGDWEPTLRLLRGADMLIAERFHYIAAGAHAGLPLLPILGTGKATHLVTQLGLTGPVFDCREFTAALTLAALLRVVPASSERCQKLTDELRRHIEQVRSDLEQPIPPYSTAARLEARQVARSILSEGVSQKRYALKRRLAGKS